MFNKTLEILKKSRFMLRKKIFFAITTAILDLENRYYFLNIPVITQIEFMNIEMYEDKRLGDLLAAILNFCSHFEFLSQQNNHKSTLTY